MAEEELMEPSITIKNEDDAFHYLKLALTSELGEKPIRIDFQNWPLLTISLEGKGYDSTITSHMAEALVDLQHAMNRTYARTVRGSSNPNVLTNEQKQTIEFKAKVEKGSSLVTVDLGEYATALATGLAGKVDGTQLVIAAVSIAITAGSVVAYKTFLKHRSEDKKVEADTQVRIALSKEETTRLKIMQEVTQAHPKLAHVAQDFDDARHSIVKSVGDANTIKMQGVVLNRAEARTIVANPRSSTEDIQLNGNYRIDKLDWTKEGEVRISLWSTDISLEFTARLNTEILTADQKEMLKVSEWERQHLHLQINATRLRGEITTATIVGIEWPKKVDTPA